MSRSEDFNADPRRQGAAAWLQRIWPVFALALIAATWRLWTPQSVFPQAPLLRAALILPSAFDWIALVGMASGAVAAAALPLANRWSRGGGLLFSAGVLLAVVIDQHRLQPWAWQFLL